MKTIPPPRLILLTQWFDPEPTFKGLLFAKLLVERGFLVEVVTGFPNYPGGKIYPGYKVKTYASEEIDGVTVTRLPLYPSHNRSALGRSLNYLSFFLSVFVYLSFFAKKADVLYAYHPPLTVGLAANIAGLFRPTPMVLDIQDMWPDTLKATGMLNNKPILLCIGRLCRWVYKRAAHIVVLSPGFKKLLISRGVPEEKLSVIYNWADERALTCKVFERPKSMPDDGNFRVLFAGNLGLAQALDTVLDAAVLSAKDEPRVKVCLIGNGVELERLKARVATEGITSVEFLPSVPMVEVGNYLNAANSLLVHLRSDPLFEITIPSKTQAYLCIGKPVIMGVSGDAATLINESGGGITVPPCDSKALAAAIVKLARLDKSSIDKMGMDSFEFYQQNLSSNHGADSFLRIFELVMQARSTKS